MENSALSGGYFDSEQLRIFGFASLGSNCRVSKRVEIQDPSAISLGDNVRIDAFTTITTGVSGHLTVGSNTHIADGVRISAAAGVQIGSFVGLASRVVVLSSSDDYSGEHMVGPLAPSGSTGGKYGTVVIDDFAVVGTATVIFPGSQLGEGCSVGAMSLVNRNLQSWSMYFGVPARFIRTRSRSLLNFIENSSTQAEP